MSTYTPIALLKDTEAERIIETLGEVEDDIVEDTVASIIEYYTENYDEPDPNTKRPRHLLSFPLFTEEEHFHYRDYLLITNEDFTSVFILKRIDLFSPNA